MATLLKTPYPGFEMDYKDFEGSIKRQERLLQQIKDGGTTVLEFGVADGHALYAVIKRKPLTLQHIPFLDAYQIPAAYVRGLRIEDVERQEAADRFWEELRS